VVVENSKRAVAPLEGSGQALTLSMGSTTETQLSVSTIRVSTPPATPGISTVTSTGAAVSPGWAPGSVCPGLAGVVVGVVLPLFAGGLVAGVVVVVVGAAGWVVTVVFGAVVVVVVAVVVVVVSGSGGV
jgi:hypothetical protein